MGTKRSSKSSRSISDNKDNHSLSSIRDESNEVKRNRELAVFPMAGVLGPNDDRRLARTRHFLEQKIVGLFLLRT